MTTENKRQNLIASLRFVRIHLQRFNLNPCIMHLECFPYVQY